MSSPSLQVLVQNGSIVFLHAGTCDVVEVRRGMNLEVLLSELVLRMARYADPILDRVTMSQVSVAAAPVYPFEARALAAALQGYGKILGLSRVVRRGDMIDETFGNVVRSIVLPNDGNDG